MAQREAHGASPHHRDDRIPAQQLSFIIAHKEESDPDKPIQMFVEIRDLNGH